MEQDPYPFIQEKYLRRNANLLVAIAKYSVVLNRSRIKR